MLCSVHNYMTASLTVHHMYVITFLSDSLKRDDSIFAKTNND